MLEYAAQLARHNFSSDSLILALDGGLAQLRSLGLCFGTYDDEAMLDDDEIDVIDTILLDWAEEDGEVSYGLVAGYHVEPGVFYF